MESITSKLVLEEHCGLHQPKDPWAFATAVQASQKNRTSSDIHTILFNKGRYFETTIYNSKIRQEVSELIQSPVKYDSMIVDSWRKLEDFVIAMNCLGIHVIINIDWI